MPAVVIDLGSYRCRAGFAGEEAPKVDELTLKLGGQPFQGRVPNFMDNYKVVVKKLYELLGVAPTAQPAFVTCSLRTSDAARGQITDFFSNELKVPALYLDTTFNINAKCTSNAVLVDLGYQKSEIAAVAEGTFIDGSGVVHVMNGSELSKYIEKAFKATTPELIEEIKETQLCVVPNFDEACEKGAPDVDFKGLKLTGQERLNAGESNFIPFFVNENLESDGLANDINNSCKKAPVDFRAQLLENVVVYGGPANLKGLQPRLENDLKGVVPPAVKDKVKVRIPEKPQYYNWVCLSVYAEANPSAAK